MTLIECDSLLDQLEGGLATAASGEGVLVLLTGEAGAGKTSVVREFEKRLGRKALVLWGACDPLTTPRPLSPLLDVMKMFIGPTTGPSTFFVSWSSNRTNQVNGSLHLPG
ncbi:MAG: AAA family ATPase [Actinobacteria bacterium]|nr:AAA family ATPase [Actinomycetota bacterium]